MKIPAQRKILREDLKDAPSWAFAIVDPINTFMENMFIAMSKNVTLNDNIACFIKEVTYKTDSTYPSDQPVVQFLSPLKAKPIGCSILQILDRATYLPPTGPCYVPWTEMNNSISIYTIPGLAADTTYIVRLLVF